MNAEMRPQHASDYSLLINGKLVDGASTFRSEERRVGKECLE